MRWTILLAAACSGGTTKPTTGETGGPGPTPATGDTGDTGTTTSGQCLYDLDLWCFNQEYPPGPGQTTGTCPTVTVEELMSAGSGYYFEPTHLRCTEATHGVLDVVNQPTGFGGPVWYFDESGALVAYAYATDYPLCSIPGSDGLSHYGFVPDCADWCEVEDPNDWYSYPTCP